MITAWTRDVFVQLYTIQKIRMITLKHYGFKETSSKPLLFFAIDSTTRWQRNTWHKQVKQGMSFHFDNKYQLPRVLV